VWMIEKILLIKNVVMNTVKCNAAKITKQIFTIDDFFVGTLIFRSVFWGEERFDLRFFDALELFTGFGEVDRFRRFDWSDSDVISISLLYENVIEIFTPLSPVCNEILWFILFDELAIY